MGEWDMGISEFQCGTDCVAALVELTSSVGCCNRHKCVKCTQVFPLPSYPPHAAVLVS